MIRVLPMVAAAALPHVGAGVGQATEELSPLDIRFRRQAVRRLVFDRDDAIPLASLTPGEIVDLAVEHPVTAVSGVETVEVGAGSFEAHRVELEPLDGAADTSTFYIRLDAPPCMVRKEGRLPASRIGKERHRRFRKEDLDKVPRPGEEITNIEALLKLSAKADPVLAEVWDNDKDAAYDRV